MVDLEDVDTQNRVLSLIHKSPYIDGNAAKNFLGAFLNGNAALKQNLKFHVFALRGLCMLPALPNVDSSIEVRRYSFIARTSTQNDQ